MIFRSIIARRVVSKLPVLLATLALGPHRATAQTLALSGAPTESPRPVSAVHSVWRAPSYWLGAGTSILAHEAGHVAVALALGRPTFGFDKGRPTVYSGIDARQAPHEQFVFSSAGLTVQALLDELLLDAPTGDGPASSFRRGLLAGGLGTTLFYCTLGRSGSVSDIDYMSRTSRLSKTELTLIFGGIGALHALRIARDGRFAHFFAEPTAEGAMRVGLVVR